MPWKHLEPEIESWAGACEPLSFLIEVLLFFGTLIHRLYAVASAPALSLYKVCQQSSDFALSPGSSSA